MELRLHPTSPLVLILAADSQLDAPGCDELVTGLQQHLDAGVRTLIVDCSEVGYVGSMAVCRLIRLHKRFAQREGRLILTGVQQPLSHVLEITRLDQVFHLAGSVEEALRAAAATPLTTAK